MKPNKKEIQRRTEAALLAIKQAMSEGDEDSSVKLFVSHHLQELDATCWKKHAGTARPSPKKVLDLLELRSHWGEDADGDIDEDGIDTFDFSLPGDATQYVISVRFDEAGEVEDIEMES
jgi:hypothetical protein